MMRKDIIPDNKKGKQVDLEAETTLINDVKASETYVEARKRLLQPALWKGITGKLAAEFRADKKNKGDAYISEGDYIKIDIPAPGLSAGDGHDWVQVLKIEEDFDSDSDESIALTLKVAENPNHPEKGVAHFFEKGATSSFVIKRLGTKVHTSYHGRNEVPNTDNPGLGDKVRNFVVAVGALAGMSELQWKSLLNGLLSNEH